MWRVWEEDERGYGFAYYYLTRARARKHIKRVRRNPFLRGWLVRGVHTRTLREVV